MASFVAQTPGLKVERLAVNHCGVDLIFHGHGEPGEFPFEGASPGDWFLDQRHGYFYRMQEHGQWIQVHERPFYGQSPDLSEMPDMDVSMVFCDGGLIKGNPSPLGGTWAFVLADWNFKTIREESGVIIPGGCNPVEIGNNLTELMACYHALQALPDGWSGKFFCDSLNTIRRVFQDGHKKEEWGGVDPDLRANVLAERARLGRINVTLLAGHPSKEDLNRGFKLRTVGNVTRAGLPVHELNERCDTLCKEQSLRRLMALGLEPLRGEVTQDVLCGSLSHAEKMSLRENWFEALPRWEKKPRKTKEKSSVSEVAVTEVEA